MSLYDDKIAVVTGAASGIGRAACEQIAGQGGQAIAVDLDAGKLAWADEQPAVHALSGDVTSAETNAAMVEAAAKLGGLDAVLLNAGVPSQGLLESQDLADFDRVLDVNLRAVVLGMRAAIPALKARGGGAIVVTASVSGLGGDPNMWAYNAAKGGVVNLVRSACLELAQHRIRVNAVCPGPIRTGMTEPLSKIPGVYDALREHIPMQRWGEAAEVARVLTFLASEQASFVTGAIVPVDGGVTASSGQFNPPQLPA
jgi:meso-butanediol dehydrogenase/(S,S)-butanediol dehydrogenase/diacetyl reductase